MRHAIGSCAYFGKGFGCKIDAEEAGDIEKDGRRCGRLFQGEEDVRFLKSFGGFPRRYTRGAEDLPAVSVLERAIGLPRG